MKKIAIFQKDLGMGGIQKSLINMLNNIDYSDKKVDLYLFSKEDFFLDKLSKEVNIIYLKPMSKIFKVIPFNISKIFSSYNINEEYDYVIDFNSYSTECASAAINIKSKEKIMWIHNDVVRERKYNFKYRILRMFFKGKYKYFDKFVGVSEGVVDPFRKLNKVYDKEIVVIPNYLDTFEIREKMNEELDFFVDNNKYNLVSVGRLTRQKGFDILLNKFKNVLEKNNQYHLYIIGEGEEKSKLIRQCEILDIKDYVTFLGGQNNPFKYMKKMDGFVLTSRYEGQGIVVMEAKSVGLDLFISDNLKPYLSGIEFSSDIVSEILNAKKHDKTFDDLKEYNINVLKKINELFY